MSYEKYDNPERGQNSTSAFMSINKRGLFQISLFTGIKVDLCNYSHCFLHYDADNNHIKIELLSKKEDAAIKIGRGRSSITILGRGFLNYFDIVVDKMTRCPLVAGEEPNLLIADISDTNQWREYGKVK